MSAFDFDLNLDMRKIMRLVDNVLFIVRKEEINIFAFVCCLKVNTIIPKSQSHLRSG